MKVLSIGTAVVDLFLSIDRKYYKSNSNSVEFRLGNKIPMSAGDMAIGGNAANVSVGLSRLGFESLLYTYLGRDTLSLQVQKDLSSENIEIIPGIPRMDKTPLHLIFNFENDRIIFSDYPKERYQFRFDKKSLPDYIFLTSIGEEWEEAYTQALEFIQTNHISLALSPGTRQLDSNDKLLFQAISACVILLVNKEEAMKILGISNEKTNIKSLFQKLHDLGPRIISVTDGANGAYASNGKEAFKIKAFNDKKPVIQKVGAGDAYASAFLAAIFQNKSLPEAMRWGAINSHSVMGHLGAQAGLLNTQDLERTTSVNPSFEAEKI